MLNKYKRIAKKRFFTKVNKTASCWLWTARLYKDGYGVFEVTTAYKETKKVRAHRYSYELHKGPIPPGMLVCHTCDNPLCVNPDHLWLGTNKDNSDDKIRKGRQARGSQIAVSKLTEEGVVEMRKDMKEFTEKLAMTLADKFFLSLEEIQSILE